MSKMIKTKVLAKEALEAGRDMELINSYSLKELTPDDVFVFSLILCDNKVDRDFERFSEECLFDLSNLFVGKTGIFNHSWNAKNQVARIYKTELEAEGDELRLRAFAYIPRSESTKDTIEKIEGGILKEVSVGAAIGETVCSICGMDLRAADCPHCKGHKYDGKLCHGILSKATDAYEFSFVAVPAQRGAGVTKSFEPHEDTPAKPQDPPPDEEVKSKSHVYVAALAAFFMQ